MKLSGISSFFAVSTLGLAGLLACGGGGGGGKGEGSNGGGGVQALVAPGFSIQPSDQSVSPSQTVTFTVAVSGNPSPALLWEKSKDGNAWDPIGGATGPTYSFVAATSDDGTHFRAKATNSQGSAVSNVGTLTVSTLLTAPVFTAQPSDLSLEVGKPASFTVAASGNPTPVLQWERSQDGRTWNAIDGATDPTYSFAAGTADSGLHFHALATNVQGSATSNVATLTVTPQLTLPGFTTQPIDVAVAAGKQACFTVVASGNPAPALQWERSSDGKAWDPIPGATSPAYSFVATASDDGLHFHVLANNSQGHATSNAGTLRVTPLLTVPGFTTQPIDVTVGAGKQASFTVAASGNPTPALQWERSLDGNGWVPIAGATSPTYSFVATTADGGSRFHALATNSQGSATSHSASLTITREIIDGRYAYSYSRDSNGATVDFIDAYFVFHADGTGSHHWYESHGHWVWDSKYLYFKVVYDPVIQRDFSFTYELNNGSLKINGDRTYLIPFSYLSGFTFNSKYFTRK